MTIAYEITTLLPSHSLEVEILPLGGSIGPREYLLTAELFAAGEERISPRDLNWSYSNALDTSFAYVPESDGAAPLRIAKALESSVPFSRAVLTVLPWKIPVGARQPAALFGTLAYRCQTNGDRNLVTADAPALYGTIAPKATVA